MSSMDIIEALFCIIVACIITFFIMSPIVILLFVEASEDFSGAIVKIIKAWRNK